MTKVTLASRLDRLENLVTRFVETQTAGVATLQPNGHTTPVAAIPAIQTPPPSDPLEGIPHNFRLLIKSGDMTLPEVTAMLAKREGVPNTSVPNSVKPIIRTNPEYPSLEEYLDELEAVTNKTGKFNHPHVAVVGEVRNRKVGSKWVTEKTGDFYEVAIIPLDGNGRTPRKPYRGKGGSNYLVMGATKAASLARHANFLAEYGKTALGKADSGTEV